MRLKKLKPVYVSMCMCVCVYVIRWEKAPSRLRKRPSPRDVIKRERERERESEALDGPSPARSQRGDGKVPAKSMIRRSKALEAPLLPPVARARSRCLSLAVSRMCRCRRCSFSLSLVLTLLLKRVDAEIRGALVSLFKRRTRGCAGAPRVSGRRSPLATVVARPGRTNLRPSCASGRRWTSPRGWRRAVQQLRLRSPLKLLNVLVLITILLK